MKVFTAALFGAALLVSGCASSDNLSSPPLSRDNTAVEQEFLQDVADYMTPALYDVPQSDVLFLGKAICHAFDNDATFADVFLTGRKNGLSTVDTQVIIASATVNLCPEHGDVLDSGESV